jgi:Fe-S cluster assembly ATP-binding protein
VRLAADRRALRRPHRALHRGKQRLSEVRARGDDLEDFPRTSCSTPCSAGSPRKRPSRFSSTASSRTSCRSCRWSSPSRRRSCRHRRGRDFLAGRGLSLRRYTGRLPVAAYFGRQGYEITGGGTTLDGEDLLALEPNERAARGVFLSFQYPLEIPGVPALTFIRTALNAQKKARGEPEITAPAFLKLAREKAALLKIDFDMLKRALNVGFSGGEKKRMEIFQMAMLSPRFLILDETDSGLDIDALRIVSEGVNALRSPDRAMLVITHYQRLLDYIKPDRVHVLAGGRIVASGGPELALELERDGYDRYARAA